MLQPINDQQQPVTITPDYKFNEAPKTRCIYHPQYIRHFCKESSCLMPLCQDCLLNHPHKLIDTIENTLSQVYRGLAQRANEIATHQRGDILQIRTDLHKLIDAIIDDVLHKADQNYQHDLIVLWRNIIKKLERLKDPNQCLKETILYYAEPDIQYQEPQLCYQGQPININYEALDQARFHLHHLFMVTLQDGEYFFRPGEKTGDNPIRKVTYEQPDYQPYNYTPPRTQSQYIIQQPIPQPQLQPQVVQIIPQVQPQPIIITKPIEQPLPQPQPLQQQQQPLVFYQESPIKLLNNKQEIPQQQYITQTPTTQQYIQPTLIQQPTQQIIQPIPIIQSPQLIQQPQQIQQIPQITQYIQQPVVRTPQTVPSIYTVSSVKAFQPQQSGEYSHPYPLN